MSEKKVYIYTRFERFWHWMQAMLIFFLLLTGFEVHGSYKFFGYDQAVRYHAVAAYALIVLIAFAIFWHAVTGQWKQYVPTRKMLTAQLRYYILGIFRDEPHPTRKTALSKLNPLQRLVYLGLKILVIPVMVISGVLYMLYRYPSSHGVAAINVDSLTFIAVLHTAGAFALAFFIIAHVYLTTTGRTVTSNLEAMMTGYEVIEDDTPDGEAPERGEPRPDETTSDHPEHAPEIAANA